MTGIGKKKKIDGYAARQHEQINKKINVRSLRFEIGTARTSETTNRRDSHDRSWLIS